ncbi:metallophosphoesterase family protein [Aquimarina litoralis]|uniref:metallophosphoesterase family protein n=1 Tax=Aquimarina litoralis TaxID=584605 RepID=UPI001C58C72C|nr:metallophosphoesterase [Aquimarina litoralis]
MSKRIAYVTDIHLDEPFPKTVGVNARENWEKILDDISKRNIKQIIIGGDIGENASLPWFFESLEPYDWSISLGNHDDFSIVYPCQKILRPNIDTPYYRWETDFFKFIFFDSSKEVVDQKQLEWLGKELITQKRILLFIHHPIIPIPVLMDKKFFLKGKEKIQSILEEYHNDITIFSGHYHMNNHQIYKNIHQYVTPAVSYQVEKDLDEIKVHSNSFGYRIIELQKDQLFTEVVLF